MTTSQWGSIYKDLGIKPIINATGSVTALGGSIIADEVRAAMEMSNDVYVPMSELEQKAGAEIARILDVPAAYITSGAGSASGGYRFRRSPPSPPEFWVRWNRSLPDCRSPVCAQRSAAGVASLTASRGNCS